jgi:hypothetical protein
MAGGTADCHHGLRHGLLLGRECRSEHCATILRIASGFPQRIRVGELRRFRGAFVHTLTLTNTIVTGSW